MKELKGFSVKMRLNILVMVRLYPFYGDDYIPAVDGVQLLSAV